MLKKIKWVLIGLAIVLIIVIIYVVSIVRYAESETTALNNYKASLSALPDVLSVHSIHRFNGLESYIVASIEHVNGEDVYFFVNDGTVQYYFFISQLINEAQANQLAQNLIPLGEIIHTQLGILKETPIFEVQIAYEGVIHYIMIDAETREVLMNFYL